jgi:hypothetical protein
MQASWLTLSPGPLCDVIFDQLILQQEADKLWWLMAYISDQIYSRIHADIDHDSRRVELIIFQVRFAAACAASSRCLTCRQPAMPHYCCTVSGHQKCASQLMIRSAQMCSH